MLVPVAGDKFKFFGLLYFSMCVSWQPAVVVRQCFHPAFVLIAIWEEGKDFRVAIFE